MTAAADHSWAGSRFIGCGDILMEFVPNMFACQVIRYQRRALFMSHPDTQDRKLSVQSSSFFFSLQQTPSHVSCAEAQAPFLLLD